MRACRRHLKGSFYVFLPADILESEFVKIVADFLLKAQLCRLQMMKSIEKVDDIHYCLNAVNVNIFNDSGFICVGFRHYHAFETFFSGLYRYRQRPFYRVDTAVKRQLTHNDVFVKQIDIYLLRRGKNRYRQRQVIT